MKTKKYSDYQKESRKTWMYVNTESAITYPTLGLVNEAGEVAGKIKKILRDKKGKISREDKEALRDELGDVFWYFTQLCTELGLSIEDVAEANLDKLFSRLSRNKIHGDGDNR